MWEGIPTFMKLDITFYVTLDGMTVLNCIKGSCQCSRIKKVVH
jgi:hypothetical protein